MGFENDIIMEPLFANETRNIIITAPNYSLVNVGDRHPLNVRAADQITARVSLFNYLCIDKTTGMYENEIIMEYRNES